MTDALAVGAGEGLVCAAPCGDDCILCVEPVGGELPMQLP